MNADRYYLGDKIKIKHEVVLILKNMNINVIQRAKEYDYPFLFRLLTQVFGPSNLALSSGFSMNRQKTAYARLDMEKYKFVEGKFLFQL